MQSNLGEKSARGAAWSIGSQGVQVILNLLAMAILARIVTQADFGVVAMVAALVGFGELFRDFGLTNAVIQAPSVSKSESNNLFWINTLIGLLLGLVFWLGAQPITQFYDQPELFQVTRVIAFLFVINGISTQPRAMLARNLRLKALAAVEVLAAVAGLIVGVSIALAGYGYWALLGLQIGKAGTNMILAILVTKFVPTVPDRSVSVRHFLRFGIGLFGAQMLTYLSKNIDKVMIGRVLGPAPLGVYTRAYDLGHMPISQLTAPIARVALPVLSQLRPEPQLYSHFLFRAQKALMLTVSLGYAVAIVFADIVINLALGSGWEAAIPIFQIICFAGIMEGAHSVTYWIFVSTGQTGRNFLFAIFARPLLILGTILAVSKGIEAVALVFAIWIFFAWPAGVFVSTKSTTIPTRLVLVNGLRILVPAGLAISVGLGARELLSNLTLWLELALSAFIMSLAVSLLIGNWLALRKDVLETIRVFLLVLPKRFLQSRWMTWTYRFW